MCFYNFKKLNKEATSTELQIISLGSKRKGFCLAFEGKHGYTVIDAGNLTLSLLERAVDISRVRNICVSSFAPVRFGNIRQLLLACERAHIEEKNIRELRLMGPSGIRGRLNVWEKTKKYFAFPLPIYVADGRRWSWSIKSFQVPGSEMGFIHYGERQMSVFLPRFSLMGIESVEDLRRANILVAGLSGEMIGAGDSCQKLLQELWGMAAKKTLLVPLDREALPGIERLHDADPSLLIAKEGMSVWTR